ncbi:DEAD/DEAH box helicase [Deinococcus aquiradiocola]|uniref:ATP-dependent helicase n=1 Tax=Deinococcus aquiradiocola TaxID=393059 RepID=A0A917UUW6_9DEIO|nr:DEAD/DEAH box helicase [Deinococcus aquiradiocola]GGJ88014.1 ATP-dependent helicase [Deinococcus aquiradiocola]
MPKSAAHLDAFLRDVLGGGAATLHEEEPGEPQLVQAASLGWSDAVRRGFGFPQVYSHQAETYRRMRSGEHVIVTTPTASGKTGAFFPAVFERLEQDPEATALFLYPLVALGQDQRAKLGAFRDAGGFDWEIGEFHGNAQAGDVFRPGVRMVTATPDKLHWALTQPGVQRFLSRLSVVVLDEAHTYRGGFGSEVAGMLRRLLDLSAALLARDGRPAPQVLLSTATIGNPAQFARELAGVDVQEVSESGAGRHGKRYVLADHGGQPRRFWDGVMQASVRRDLKVLAFFRGRSRAARLYGTYRASAQYAGHAHLYMSGTSDREGRLNEFRRAGSGVMFATNALEAGVDIGDLEVVILDGYPGTRMAFRQMAGRAGRVSPGLVLYLPALDDRGLPHPVDAFYSNAGNFRELLTGPTERAVVEAANPFLAPRHAERAAFERMVAGLEGPGHASPRHWNLRGEGSAKYHVVEEDAWQKYGAASFHAPLESPAQHYALTEKHVDAMFEQEGQGYRVTRWVPHRDGTAILVEKTQASGVTTRGLYGASIQTQQMGEWQHRGPLVFRHGEVTVQRRYTGYTLLKTVFERVCTGCDREPTLHERQCRACGGRIQDRMQDHKLSEHLFDTPTELEPLHTRALEVGVDARASSMPDAVAHTLKHLLQKLIPERVACDGNDLAGAFRDGKPTYFFLYDDWKGGLGVTRRAYEQMDELLRRALDLCQKTCCQDGCYACTSVSRCASPFYPSGERRPTSKAATRQYLQDLLGLTPAPGEDTPDAPPPPPVPDSDWPLQAREWLDLYGLSLPEVSARLGIPSREIQRAVSSLGPMRLHHPSFGEGHWVGGSGSGDARTALVYFRGAGQKKLLVKVAGLRVLQERTQPT